MGNGNINCTARLWSENWGRHLLQKWVKMKNAVLDCPPAHLNPTHQINQLFRGHPGCLGQASRGGKEENFKAQVTQTCRSLFNLREGGRTMPQCTGAAEALGVFRLALQDGVVRCSSSSAICLFVSACSLMRCVLNVLGLKRC